MTVLHNIHTIEESTIDVILKDGKITDIQAEEKGNDNALHLYFDNAFIFPGLINSHDHLEFNLFPQLGNFIYNNYLEWGSDIHQQDKDIINAVLKVPKQLRAKWGMYKNLVSGVTTVVQHGAVFNLNAPIDIFQDSFSLHSIGLEKHWKYKLNKLFAKNQPYVIHIGEGTDDVVFKEIDELIKWNFLKRKIIAVHGIAMNNEQAKAFDALIWCPDSNFFLYNTTAQIDKLKKETKVLFGTDSTVSADWNIWKQLRMARATGMLTDDELFNTLNLSPALVWGLSSIGSIAENKNADIVIAKLKNKEDKLDSFFSLNPEDILLIIKNEGVILFDEQLFSQLKDHIQMSDYSKIFINNTGKFVKGNIPALMNEIKKYEPEIIFPVEVE
ncbi:amidohydrolase family protein [Panacibacter ginsenosidivorans]|uniref:Amidohydrolase family protein n=1 Tax=Panacibacter ginsenosidivorans TaxID=1813871 RepID=A0A5B8V469_9BACT|nr:amidohydrolase family protein [Panacibacter ginsenosidivorans]QEC66170.1 amidohydrolase family protein [Panacibacter ginsenosidivorans]